jgi:NAD+ kinase
VLSDVAVNDVVINRGTLARLITLNLFLGDEHMGALRSDGVIVSTPNGSTAYSISAGGPVLHPDLEVFSVTPICPFLHNFRPIVLPGDAELFVEVSEDTAQVFLTQDGQIGFRLLAGDRIGIRRREPGPVFVKTSEGAYVRKLRDKGVLE